MWDPRDLYNRPTPSNDLSELRCSVCGLRVLDTDEQARGRTAQEHFVHVTCSNGRSRLRATDMRGLRATDMPGHSWFGYSWWERWRR